MKSGMLIENFYANFTTRVKKINYAFYKRDDRKEHVRYVAGNDLLTLGLYHCSAVNNRDIVRLRKLYKRIIRWLADEMRDIGRVKLYMLRGEEVLDNKTIADLQESIAIVEFDSITQKIFWPLSRGGFLDEVLGYAYRLQDRVITISKKYKTQQAAGQPKITSSDVKFIDQELRFLKKLWELYATDDREFNTVSVDIYQKVADLYIEAGKKDKALELLNIAVSQSDKHKELVGRAVYGSVKVKRQAKALSRELAAS